jgi:hypothetical protein
MKPPTVFCLLLVLLLSNTNNPSAKHPDTKTSEWKLVWQDEFSGPKGSPVDKTKWSAQVGGSGWGNRELEYYTDRTINAFQSEGMLNITALKEHFTGMDA